MIPAIYDWSGVYIGINGGGGSSRNCYTITSVAGVAVNPNSEGCHDATGGLAGGQLGYRWQSASWVFGVEAMGDWADLKGSNSSLTAIIPYMNQTKIDAIGLFTGQVGYAWNNVLWYVKGGAAITDNKYTASSPRPGPCSIRPTTPAGAERWEPASKSALRRTGRLALNTTICSWALTTSVYPPTAIAVGRTDNLRQDVDMGTVRINYRFGGPVIAKY